jgi:hypothetical protein
MNDSPGKRIPWDDDNPLARVDAIDPYTGKPYERAEQNRALRYSFVTGLSLEDLCKAFRKHADANPDHIAMWQSDSAKPPIKRLRTLEAWSADLDWEARKTRQADIDAAADEEARKQRRAEAIAYIEDKGIEHGQLIIEAIDRLLRAAKPGEIVNIVTRDEQGRPKVEEVELLSVPDYIAVMKLRLDTDALIRRAVGLPDKYTQTRLADHEGGPASYNIATIEVVRPQDDDTD